MHAFLHKLIDSDTRLKLPNNSQQIIEQGMAPIVALKNDSTIIQKAKLLEQAKLINWNLKASLFFNSLQKENIEFLIFKGFSYTYLLYQQSNLRPYADIDILIDIADYLKVEDILYKAGYQMHPSRQGRFVSYQNSFYDNNIPRTTFDVHWQINNRIEFHKHFDFKKLLQQSQPIKTSSFEFQTLNLENHFILACFHYLAHRPEDRKHIWLYDMALIWHKMNTVQKKDCLNTAKSTNQTKILDACFNLLNEVFGKNITPDRNLKFKNPQKSEATEDYTKPRNKKITDIRIKFKNINGFSNKLRFLLEYVFQSRNYVQQRYNLKSNLLVFFYYPRMWVEDFIKLFK